ncbi:hypothetical protein TI39_contig602g00003 [Zymoseptoria brevis]|uniref:Uncharacterized protein n=1 Tax=Zymoseptoria brevis TaxID=1047168 RepID=A0A0F4GHJ0_9PEZI|nr:hypothetical protein TI39_contig602g00003 [Zymoseptoria brevis]
MGQTVRDIAEQLNENAGYAAYDGYHSDMDECFTDEEEDVETVRINGQDVRPRIVPMIELVEERLESIAKEEDSIFK